jgi:CubicO group peptidase (beta-lactamase class C family)
MSTAEDAAGGAITVRQLLDMRSGLFDYLNDGDSTVLDAVRADPAHQWAPAISAPRTILRLHAIAATLRPEL